MTPTDYLHAIRHEGDALAAAARRGLDLRIPSTPGWSVRDVVGHVGAVHRHKEEIVRRRIMDSQPEMVVAPAGDAALLAWYEEGLDALIATLKGADPETPVITWHPPEQNVGFWLRRMAHETAIHRADAEIGHGGAGPLPGLLAADGIDEILRVMICPYTRFAKLRGDHDETLTIAPVDVVDTWVLYLNHDGGWTCESGGPGAETTTEVRGTASDLVLYLWGRGSLSDLVVAGDELVMDRVREVAAEAGQ